MAETVIVGCKLPNGLLLTVGEQTIRINGRARYNMPSPTRKTLNTLVEYADGLTTVDKAFWETWVAAHKDYVPLKRGFIYASPGMNDATARAKDTESMKTGLEPLDPLAAKNIEPADNMVIKNARKGK